MAFLVCLLFRESIGVAITKSFVIFVRIFFVSSIHVQTEVSPCTHDLAKLLLLPILYSVSRVNAYLNSQHPYECPYYKLPMPWSSDRENSVALSSI